MYLTGSNKNITIKFLKNCDFKRYSRKTQLIQISQGLGDKTYDLMPYQRRRESLTICKFYQNRICHDLPWLF
jgi:hypothetical protein